MQNAESNDEPEIDEPPEEAADLKFETYGDLYEALLETGVVWMTGPRIAPSAPRTNTASQIARLEGLIDTLQALVERLEAVTPFAPTD